MPRIREYHACPIATRHSEVLERGTAKQVRAHELHMGYCNLLIVKMNHHDPSSAPRKIDA